MSHTWHHLQRHLSRMQMERCLGKHLSKTINENRQYIQFQLLCQIEGTPMEPLNLAIWRACSFRKTITE